MRTVKDMEFGGERPLYCSHDLRMQNVTIHAGESGIKESSNIEAEGCTFEGKYVFWETDHFSISDSYFSETSRASLWYSRYCKMNNCKVDAPKMFRRMHHIHVESSEFTKGEETFWDCSDVVLRDVRISDCDYLFMHTKEILINNYHQDGNYSFQYAHDVEIHNAVINSKDAFWESENVTLVDCDINGEYLGWYAKNMKLIRCRITGIQPLCYIDGLILEDCTFGEDANLMLEYTKVNGNIKGNVTSIKNPTTGTLRVEGKVGEYIIDNNQKAPADFRLIRIMPNT